MLKNRMGGFLAAVAACVGALLGGSPLRSAELTLQADMVLDAQALLMPRGSTYGPAINGVSYNSEALLTAGGYQYATWYHLGPDDEYIYLARRDLTGTAWEVMDTGQPFVNGDNSWDAHNVVSMGVDGDGRIHLSYDHHNHYMNYRNTDAGAATGAAWNASLINPEANTLNTDVPNPPPAPFDNVTYPRFATDPTTGNLLMTFRRGGSGNGDLFFSTYDVATDTWATPHEIINGTAGGLLYDDPYGGASTNRNAYLNGIDVDGSGRIHLTWTWREAATGSSNHDIMYVYSDDGGATWRNTAGSAIGTVGNPVTMNSRGVRVVTMDRGNTLMNQQTQIVDGDGIIHAVMWHKTDEAPPVVGFTAEPAAYYHYYRDDRGSWTRTDLPQDLPVGSRPDMAADADGNLYVTYVAPGPTDGGGVTANYYTNGNLVVATASKATGWQDWQIVYVDPGDFVGEPQLDHARLAEGGVVSIFVQKNGDNASGPTGSPLHVFEWNKLANKRVWVGDDAATWQPSGGADWDGNGDDVGDAAFANGERVQFDDNAASFAVQIAADVAPSDTEFANTAGHDYVLVGQELGGAGGVRLIGGGTVTFKNTANGYTGATDIEAGTLHLSGAATLAGTSAINVRAGGSLNVTAATTGSLQLQSQPLLVEGAVQGAVDAASGSSIMLAAGGTVSGDVSLQTGSSLSGAGAVGGNLTASAGTLLQIGAAGLPVASETSSVVIDDFADGNLSEYTQTLVNDGNGAVTNVAFTAAGGSLTAEYAGAAAFEQTLLLRDDFDLDVGETLRVDLNMGPTDQQMDLGLAISETATPQAATPGDTNTRTTFDWSSVSIRPSSNNIRVNQSDDGSLDTSTGAASGVSETSLTGLFIQRISATEFAVGFTNGQDVDQTVHTLAFAAGEVGAALGFYADLRDSGSLGVLDNLRIESSTPTFVGEMLSVDGDVSLAADAIAAFDIATPGVADRLTVGGALAAGGTLQVTREDGLPALVAGDGFDLLDFASATGEFAEYVLPGLDAGLAWAVGDLGVSGEIRVVVDVDLNEDGWVDGSDYLALQRSSPALLGAWQELFGQRLVHGASSASAVPEPSAWALLGAAVMLAAGGRATLDAARSAAFAISSYCRPQ
ncbi:MAG: hypothetical protein CMJ58_27965 [Planctomycetaceae bacterium]|nr:hypothetical protein [Planctomycetaceae bacterium]